MVAIVHKQNKLINNFNDISNVEMRFSVNKKLWIMNSKLEVMTHNNDKLDWFVN